MTRRISRESPCPRIITPFSTIPASLTSDSIYEPLPPFIEESEDEVERALMSEAGTSEA